MADAKTIAGRVRMQRTRCHERDNDHKRIIAMRKGKYEEVAPGLFNTSEFAQPLVSNLIDTTARDVAEVMAPLPTFNCQSASLSSEADQNRQDRRAAIANGYVQNSRLQNQMFGGADRYASFGFMSYAVEADLDEQMPVIKVGCHPSAYYVKDYRGRVKQFFEVYSCSPHELSFLYPEKAELVLAQYGHYGDGQTVEVVRWHDDDQSCVMILDNELVLYTAPNPLKRCMVHVVERPDLTDGSPRGQFDDVLWVQIARALVQMYTMNALERSVNAPIVLPDDINEFEIGPYAAIKTKNPQGVGTVPLQISPGLFPEAQMLQMEQMMGSRYPEGRSGSIDASIITGQGVQALMGTFDTQVQTFQRLNASALEDVLRDCLELDEKLWPNKKKTVHIKDNGAPRRLEYTPSKDIAGDYVVDVTYGAIAGLDPNRGLVFLLQSLAGNLISKSTARRHLPVELNVLAEERQIQLEQMDDSIAAAMAQLPLAIPQMAMGGADPRELTLQIVEARKLIGKGRSPAEAIEKVFAPKQTPQEQAPNPMDQLMQQAQAPGGMPGQGQGGASDLLLGLAGLTPGGSANLQANVSTRRAM